MRRQEGERALGRFLNWGLGFVIAFFKSRQPIEPQDVPPAPERYAWEDSYPADIRWRAEFPVRPLYSMFDDAVARFPDNTCVDFLGKQYSYREIGRLVDCAAKGLQGLGVDKSVQVGLFLPNCPYTVIFYYAMLKAGGTVVNINPLYAEEEILRQLRDFRDSHRGHARLAQPASKLQIPNGQSANGVSFLSFLYACRPMGNFHLLR